MASGSSFDQFCDEYDEWGSDVEFDDNINKLEKLKKEPSVLSVSSDSSFEECSKGPKKVGQSELRKQMMIPDSEDDEPALVKIIPKKFPKIFTSGQESIKNHQTSVTTDQKLPEIIKNDYEPIDTNINLIKNEKEMPIKPTSILIIKKSQPEISAKNSSADFESSKDESLFISSSLEKNINSKVVTKSKFSPKEPTFKKNLRLRMNSLLEKKQLSPKKVLPRSPIKLSPLKILDVKSTVKSPENQKELNSPHRSPLVENLDTTPKVFSPKKRLNLSSISTKSSLKVRRIDPILKTPLRIWQKEDFKVNLSPLDLNEELTEFVKIINQSAAMNENTSSNKVDLLESNLHLKNIYISILEKFALALEKIPNSILRQFPQFHQDGFEQLKVCRKFVKAKCIKNDRKLTDSGGCSSGSSSPIVTPVDQLWNEEKNGTPLKVTEPFKKLKPLENIGIRDLYSYFPVASTSVAFEPQQKLESVERQSSDLTQFPPLGDDLYERTETVDLMKVPPPKPLGDFMGDFENAGLTGQFDRMDYEHSNKLKDLFRNKFGLFEFRPNQLQAMNAAMLGHDCFVLMPTGGGKSIIYQLTAMLCPGITIVVSPLKSLVHDQVQKMITLDVPAAHMLSDSSDTELQKIYYDLSLAQPKLKILFVTPEKVTASGKLSSILKRLYDNNLLSRFVVDEAHCVSQWGYDFRPDYKKLSYLRAQFPKVPFMALTASATVRVRFDVATQLSMNDPKWFLSSFNRPNLVYKVVEKKNKEFLSQIIGMIKTKYRNDCGIVYCFSRKDCDYFTEQLCENKIKAASYHAGLTDKARKEVQMMWITEDIKVVCATIAFGMGIDKTNVRFVIHSSIPKSIEGYYQESGRAGRDGDKADCILFYQYGDSIKMRKLMRREGSADHNEDNLGRIVSFCENKTDCRRVLQLNYFGERFDKKLCLANRETACDNCCATGVFSKVDMSAEAKAIIRAVDEITSRPTSNNKKLTLNALADLYKGSQVKKLKDMGLIGHSLHGRGKNQDRNEIDRLLHKMVADDLLREDMQKVGMDDMIVSYIRVGKEAVQFMNNPASKLEVSVKKSSGSSLTVTVTTVSSTNTCTSDAIKELQDECFAKLMSDVKGIAECLQINPGTIMNVAAVRMMSQRMPTTKEEMLEIPHVTAANYDKYGKAFLKITAGFAERKAALEKEDRNQQAIKEALEEMEESEWIETSTPVSPKPVYGRGKKRYISSKSNANAKKFKYNNGKSYYKRKTTSTKSNSRMNYSKSNNVAGDNRVGLVDFTQSKAFLVDPHRYTLN